MAPWTPGRDGYERFVGAWLCRALLLAQAEWVVLLATSYAHSEDDVPAELFAAAFADEATAFESMCATNNARDLRRARRVADARRAGVETRSIFG